MSLLITRVLNSVLLRINSVRRLGNPKPLGAVCALLATSLVVLLLLCLYPIGHADANTNQPAELLTEVSRAC
ncbi:MAG: hypothetical protein OJF50_005215 [Nitrospira sp.]|jgi:hypothetical protein|nr:hypothetical protein [Nitrospira sp.]